MRPKDHYTPSAHGMAGERVFQLQARRSFLESEPLMVPSGAALYRFAGNVLLHHSSPSIIEQLKDGALLFLNVFLR